MTESELKAALKKEVEAIEEFARVHNIDLSKDDCPDFSLEVWMVHKRHICGIFDA